jgi:hypothetical protein
MSQVVDWIDANPWRIAATLTIHTAVMAALLLLGAVH